MPDMIKVRAVPGVLFPHAPPTPGHVGHKVAASAESADHVIPCVDKNGKHADKHIERIDGDVEVPNTAYYRRALVRGDIVRAPAAVKNALVGAKSEDRT